MRMFAHLCFALATSAANAEVPLTASEFEARVTGRTLLFSSDGIAYGGEEYLNNRRVRWSFLDGECQDGRWYPAGEQICFVYDEIPGPQCWSFYLRGDRLLARFENDPTATELIETSRQDEPLLCLGPKVGA